MNRERIGLFLNAAATRDFRRIGTPTILMAREILEHAASIEEAEEIIARTPVFVSDIIVVADGKTARAKVFEKSPGGMDSYEVDGSAVVANHLVTKRFAEDPVNQQRMREGTTMQRYARARELLDHLKERVTTDELAALLRDKRGTGGKDLGYGNRNSIDGLIACHGVIMDVTAGRMWVACWPNVEGPFLGIDVVAMLTKMQGHSGQGELAMDFERQVPGLPEDGIMVAQKGQRAWDEIEEGRRAGARAEALLKAEKPDESLDQAEIVIKLNGSFYEGYELKGRALFMKGNKKGAREAFEESLKRDPPYLKRRQGIETIIGQLK
jgi:tetratricopeptide (TPR) repeat protein